MVFERINATGLHLKGLDLIRNYLMMTYSSMEQERLFKDYWAKIEENFKDDKDSEKIISKFIAVYLRIYYGTNLKDDENEIYESFKALQKNTFENKSEKILLDMMKFARIYKIIIDKNAFWRYENEDNKQKGELRRKINLIEQIGFGAAIPFVMRLIDDFENARLDFENFNEILNLLISYFVRGTICSTRTASLQNFYDTYKRIENNGGINIENLARHLGQKSGNEIFPNNQMTHRCFLEQALKSKKVVSLIFYEIEKLTNYEVPDLESLNIEHFYPQTPTQQWREMLGDEATNLEQNYLNTLGNLTLTDKGLNSKIRNKSFEDKVKMYEDFGALHLNRYFSNCDKWGIDEIKARAKELFNQLSQIEIFKDLKDEFRRTRELITLESDWHYLKPSMILFANGNEKTVSSVQDLARSIIQYLIENHPQELDIALKQGLSCIHFGEVEKEHLPLRSMIADFGEFKFICHAAAHSICTNLKKLVEACGLEPSEFEIREF